MMKIFLSKALLLGQIAFLWAGCSPSTSREQLPDYPVKGGVSAPFAGIVDNRLIVGGGCNFPDAPASEGGSKVYYDQIYGMSLDEGNPEWNLQGHLPLPVAYGTSVATEDGLICIGGMNADSCMTGVYRVEYGLGDTDFRISRLPSLPETIDNAAAAYAGGTVYVTGGNQKNGQNSLYALCPGKDKQWRRLASYPGPARSQPVVVASDTALYLIGGFSFDPVAKECALPASLLTYSIARDAWGEPVAFPEKAGGGKYALSGASGVLVDGKIILAGGVDYDRFKEAMEGRAPADYMKKPVAWYRFNPDVLVYDPQSQAWTVKKDIEGLNRAGGILLHHEGQLLLICGEIKPGIRTAALKTLPLEQILQD